MINYCTSIGYPIGINKMKDGSIAFCLELQNRIVPIPVEELKAWSCIAKHHIDSSTSNDVINKLKKRGVVVWCNTKDAFEQRLEGYSPIRQGYSTLDENGHFVVYLGNTKHTLSPIQLQLWMCSDGILPLSSCLAHLQTKGEESWSEAICVLVSKELLYLR